MKRSVWSVVLVVAVLGLVAPVAEADDSNNHDGRFSNRDVQGPYAFAFDGWAVLPGVGMVPAAATGRFAADGRGNITDAVRTLVLAGTPLHQTFTCSYNVNPDGTGSAECIVLPGSTTETFDFVVVKRRSKAFFTGTTGNVTVRGLAERQQ